MRTPKPKPADLARDLRQYPDGRSSSNPMIETALACIRQWVLVERLDATTPEQHLDRESATANLRKVAELAINAEMGLFTVTEAGRKGGRGGSNSKSGAILAEAEKRATIGTNDLQAIRRKTGASIRTVRDTLTNAGRYTPQKKDGK